MCYIQRKPSTCVSVLGESKYLRISIEIIIEI